MSGGIAKEPSLSQVTQNNFNRNIDKQLELKRSIIASSSEEMQRLHSIGMATVDYRNRRLVRI